MSEEIKLKPCSICGCSKIVKKEYHGEYWCSCVNCNASSGFANTDKDASNKWNEVHGE